MCFPVSFGDSIWLSLRFMDQMYLLHDLANCSLTENGDLPKLAFSLAMLNASSGLRSPHPMSSSAVFTFCIQPYSVLTGICSSSAAAFADPRFLANLTAYTLYSLSYSLFFDIFVSSIFPFFYFIPLWLMCQVLLYRIISTLHVIGSV